MDDLKSDALRDMDVEIRLDATRRKPCFIIETAEMTPELTRLIQQLTARAAVPIIGYQRSRSSRIPSSVSGQRTGMSTPRRKQASFSSASGSGNSKNASIRTTSSVSATAKSSTSAA